IPVELPPFRDESAVTLRLLPPLVELCEHGTRKCTARDDALLISPWLRSHCVQKESFDEKAQHQYDARRPHVSARLRRSGASSRTNRRRIRRKTLRPVPRRTRRLS